MRAGRAMLGGRPNVGKSTLFNQLLSERLAIVSKRRQTTRSCVKAVHNEPDMQLVLVDTPGWQTRDKGTLNSALNKSVVGEAAGADVGLLVLAATGLRRDDERIARLFPDELPVVAVLNKIDLLKQRDSMLPMADRLMEWRDFAAVVPVSAVTGEGCAALKDELGGLLPDGEGRLPADQRSEHPPEFFVAEFIRERIYHCLGAELPYRAAVEVRVMERTKPRTMRIAADIVVDTKSRQAMFVGAGGQMLKRIGSGARPLIERHLRKKVFLELFVKVRPDWLKDSRQLERLMRGGS